MFKCSTCSELKEQILWLRDQNKNLADRLLAISTPNMLTAFRSDYDPKGDYYGSSEHDQVLAIDEFGQSVAVDKVED